MNPSTPDHRDQELAARMGRSAGLPPAEGDALVEAIQVWKESAASQARPDDRAGARIWAGIERETRAGARRPAVRRLAPMRLIWGTLGVAATILVLVLLPRVLTPASGQLVAEAAAEQQVFEGPDGSIVTLRPHSRLFSAGDAAYRLEGEAFFAVTHDPSRTFSVQTSAGTIEVLGTRFNVSAVGDETTVYLEEGSVRFDAYGEARLLEPGQQIRHVRGRELEAPTVSDGAEETDWLRGELRFESRAAGAVAEELARHFQLTIDIPESARLEQLSGTLKLDDRQRALEDFGVVLGGRFVPSGSGVRFIGQ